MTQIMIIKGTLNKSELNFRRILLYLNTFDIDKLTYETVENGQNLDKTIKITIVLKSKDLNTNINRLNRLKEIMNIEHIENLHK